MRALFLLLASACASTLASPSFADPSGPPLGRFATSWRAPSATVFSPGIPAKVEIGPTAQADYDDALLTDAFASASDDGFRRELAIDEMAASWQPAQRTALETLREAQRRWVAAAGGDIEARDATFLAMLRDVAEGRGRSAARDESGADHGALDAAYTEALRRLPDDRLAGLDATEKAWTGYRDAFAGFALAMDHPDAAVTVRDDLARRRTQELRGTN